MSNFNMAQQPEIIHGDNKDRELIGALKQKLLSVLEGIVPAQVLFRNVHWVGAISSFLYFGGNTYRLQQTLGEEYAYLRQYNRQDHVFISKGRALLFILLETFGEAFIVKRFAIIVDRLIQRYSDGSNENPGQRSTLMKKMLKAIFRNVGSSQTLFSAIIRLHVCIFFLSGKYYNITKRLTGIQYLQAVKFAQHAFSYRRIGYIIGLQLLISLCFYVYRVYQDVSHEHRTEKIREKEAQESQNHQANGVSAPRQSDFLKCCVCFDAPVSPSVLPCGHLFCWECILKSSSFKLECPHCRKPFQRKEINCLENL